MKFITRLWLITIVLICSLTAQENILLVTYGPLAPTREGDDDFRQIIFFKVPAAIKDSIYLRIFDQDAGGNIDSPYESFDTETRFRFYGGPGAYSTATLKTDKPSAQALESGTLLKSEDVGSNPFLDNKWNNFLKFAASSGEKLGDDYYFKLIVEGVKGNDGNLFDVTLSTQEKKNVLPKGVEIFSYAPTIRLPNKGIFAEMKFFVSKNTFDITVHNFDLAGGKIGVETPFRSNLPVLSSNQDSWAKSSVRFTEREVNTYNAIRFEGGGEMPNDATFYITDTTGTYIPFSLPFYVRKLNRRPIPELTTKILSDCYTVVFDGAKSIDPDDDALTFVWNFGDGKTGEGVRIAHTYDKIGTYEAEMIAIDGSGQVGDRSLKEFTVTLNEHPIANAGENVIAAPGQSITFNGSSSSDPDGQITKYYWDFGDGQKAEGPVVTHSYTKTGIYRAVLRVEDNSDSPCNFDVNEIKVVINSSPVVDIGKDLIASINEDVILDGSKAFDSDGEIASYEWDFGDGQKGSGQIVRHQYTKPGKYTVSLKVTDNTDVSNNFATDQLTVNVNDRPVAEAGQNQVVAVGQVVNFDASQSFDRDGKIINYSWTFGDNTNGDGVKTTHTYKNPGVYKVFLTVQDNSSTTSDKQTDSLTIIVNYPPVAVAGDDQIITVSQTRFDGSKSYDNDGKLTEYLWDFGDKTFSTEISPTHVYAKPGTYKVILKVTDDSKTSSASSTDELTVIVNEKPIADAGADQIGMPGQVLSFDGSASLDPDGKIASYFWDFGDGQTAEGAKVTHAYANPGTYNVRLTVRDNTAQNEAYSNDQITVFINAQPVAKAGKNLIGAPGDILTFDGSASYDIDGKIVSYQWSFSDGTNQATTPVTKRKFDKPGFYSATLTVTDNSGTRNSKQSDQISVFINSQPLAKPGNDITTCDNTIMFNGSASGDPDGHPLKYYWNFGDGSPIDTGVVVVHTFEKGGEYPVVLTVDDGLGLANSRHSSSMTVSINRAPVANAGEDKSVCAGEIVLFDGGASSDPDGGLLKYVWDFGDSTTAEGQNPTKTYKYAGVYLVTLMVKDDSNLPCNTDRDQLVVRVAESPLADAGPDKKVCANTVVQFDGTKSKDFVDGVINNYSWDFGDQTSGGGAQPTHVYSKPGVYRVLLTVTADQVGDCDNTNRDELLVTVVAAPLAKMSYKKINPVNSVVEFDATASSGEGNKIVSYRWDYGDGTTGEGPKPKKTYTKPGKYFVKLTIFTDSETGCNENTIQDYIIINASPVAEAGPDKVVSINEAVTFNASGSKDEDGTITSFVWAFGDGDTTSGLEVQHQFRKSGKYYVVLKVQDNTDLKNNSDTDTVLVVVNEPPYPVINVPTWNCVNTDVLFDASSSKDKDGSITSYQWNFGDGTSAVGDKVTHSYQNTGSYEVTLTVTDDKNVVNSKAVTHKLIHINKPPIPFAGPDKIVCPGETVTFDGSTSSDDDGIIQKFSWILGDGSVKEGKTVSHTYAKPGRYIVRLKVSDNSGTSCGVIEDTALIIVNSSPVANAGSDISGFTGGAHDEILFDATKSSDPDGDPLTYIWDFGDGTIEKGAKVSHYYTKPGKYRVKLRVSDGSGKPCGESLDELNVDIFKR